MLWNGFNLERWFEKFFENVKEVPSVVVTEGIEPMGIAEGPYTGKPNPHAWMSPDQRADLCREHPQGAGQIRSGQCGDLHRECRGLHGARSRRSTSRCASGSPRFPTDQRWLVTSEGAFSYLTRDYGMREAYLWPINADEQGTPQQVRKVIDLVRKNKIPVVFSESTISDRAAKQVARETGARYGGVLYVDSLSAAERAGADLSRPAQGDGRDDREGFRQVNASATVTGIAADGSTPGASISVRDLTVTYRNGFTAVRDDASFELDPGTICALVGVNGSGKSTLFKAIMGFVQPVGGRRAGCAACRSTRR